MSAALGKGTTQRSYDGLSKVQAVGLFTYWHMVSSDFASLLILAGVIILAYSLPIYYLEHRLIPGPLVGTNMTDLNGLPPHELSYPLVGEPISTLWCGLVVVFVPLFIIAAFQIELRSIWDFHAGLMGLLKAVGSTTLVCTLLKHSIGGFRPFYIDACKPDLAMAILDARQQAWFNPAACTGDKYDVKRGLEGFPSGHSANSFAAAIFLTLYINAKLKVFADYSAEVWAFVLLTLPLIWAAIIAGSMYTTHQHHAHEILCGVLIGISIGAFAYRSVFAAVFDFRYNHIPLPPSAMKIRFLFDRHASPTPDVQAQKSIIITEEARLVVTGWWKQSGTEDDQRRESIWLRSIKSLEITGKELRGLLSCCLRRIDESTTQVETLKTVTQFGSCKDGAVMLE